MSNQILLNFGASREGQFLCDAIRDYARDLDTPQKRLLLMALYEYMERIGEDDIAELIQRYQRVDGRRK